MNQIMLAAVCRIIVGRTGRKIPAYPDIIAAYTQGLFADYYQYNPYVSAKTLYKYMNMSVPYPHFLARHYAGTKGYRRTLSDMSGICDACTSLALLRQIQAEVHQWIVTHLSSEEAAMINRNYIADAPNRRELAVYLADVMHYALNAENVTNRPTDTARNV